MGSVLKVEVLLRDVSLTGQQNGGLTGHRNPGEGWQLGTGEHERDGAGTVPETNSAPCTLSPRASDAHSRETFSLGECDPVNLGGREIGIFLHLSVLLKRGVHRLRQTAQGIGAQKVLLRTGILAIFSLFCSSDAIFSYQPPLL